MKVFVFLLLLGNLLFAAYAGGYFGRPENPDSERVKQQVVPERLHIVFRGEAPADSIQEKAPIVVPPDNDLSVASEVATNDTVVKAVVTPITCLAWEHLSASDADRLSRLLASKFAAFKISRTSVASEGNGWWVFIPPQSTKADADKKATELKQLEISDFFVVQEGTNRWAISLGVFSAEKGAQDRLAELKTQGVRSARASPRPGKDSEFQIKARGPVDERPALISGAKKALPKVLVEDCK